MNSYPVGIFDSGIGGLTVVKEILEVLPQENLIYLGDTGRVPYGSRSKKVICDFTLEMVRFLLSKRVKFLVVACNTISATCLDEVKALSPVPVLDVVSPAVKEAVNLTKSNIIGVIGTRATIGTGAYEREIKKIQPNCQVLSQSCPLFVPLAEEGFSHHQATKLIAKEYLNYFKKSSIDTLILGCTHYPILSNVISETMGKKVTLVNSGKPTAQLLKEELIKLNLLNGDIKVNHEFYVTDQAERLNGVVEEFMGKLLPGKLTNCTLG